MKRTGLQWLAISVLLISALSANADTRPQYGGTLHITTSMSTSSLDPAEMPDSVGARNLVALIFDTLVIVDATGRPQSALAESWQSVPGDRGVEFHLRRNVKFHDGNPLTTEIVVSSLRKASPAWNVTAGRNVVSIESAGAIPELLQELSLSRNAIAKRDATGNPSGTGPFHIVDWQPGKRLVADKETRQEPGKIGTPLALARLESNPDTVSALSGLTANRFKTWLRQSIQVISRSATQPKSIRAIKVGTEKTWPLFGTKSELLDKCN